MHARLPHGSFDLIVECYIRNSGWFGSRTVSEKAIVNDRWTSNGQHVSHTTMHKMYIPTCFSYGRERKKERRDASWPFCLNEEDRADCVVEECVCNICTPSDVPNKTFEMDICRKARARAPLSFNSFESRTKRGIGRVHITNFCP